MPGPSGKGPWVTSTSIKSPLGTKIEVTLGNACVRPGAEQTLKVTTVKARPSVSLVYQAIYADGKHGFSPGYYGGNDRGLTDAAGTFIGRWTVGDRAPPGAVHVDVYDLGGPAGRIRVGFKVADSQGSCP
jgi:hypothetical protein